MSAELNLSPSPLYEQYQQAVQNGGDELTSFLNKQRIQRFQAKEKIEQLMPFVAREARAGNFQQLEDLDHIGNAKSLVDKRYDIYYTALVANGALNLHLDQLKEKSAPKKTYQSKKELALRAIDEQLFIRPFTLEQNESYLRVKSISQAQSVQKANPQELQPEGEQNSEQIPKPEEEAKLPTITLNLANFSLDKNLIYLNNYPIQISTEEHKVLSALSQQLDYDLNRGELWKSLGYTPPIDNERLDDIVLNIIQFFTDQDFEDAYHLRKKGALHITT